MNVAVSNLLERRKRIDNQIKKIRETCKHPDHTLINKGNTGNFCPGDDSYWSECECKDCGAQWHQTQGRDSVVTLKFY